MNMDGTISAICQHWAILLIRPLKMSQKIVFRLVLVLFTFFLQKQVPQKIIGVGQNIYQSKSFSVAA